MSDFSSMSPRSSGQGKREAGLAGAILAVAASSVFVALHSIAASMGGKAAGLTFMAALFSGTALSWAIGWKRWSSGMKEVPGNSGATRRAWTAWHVAGMSVAGTSIFAVVFLSGSQWVLLPALVAVLGVAVGATVSARPTFVGESEGLRGSRRPLLVTAFVAGAALLAVMVATLAMILRHSPDGLLWSLILPFVVVVAVIGVERRRYPQLLGDPPGGWVDKPRALVARSEGGGHELSDRSYPPGARMVDLIVAAMMVATFEGLASALIAAPSDTHFAWVAAVPQATTTLMGMLIIWAGWHSARSLR